MSTTHSPKDTAAQGKAIANELTRHVEGHGHDGFADNRPEALAQGHLAGIMAGSAQMKRLHDVRQIANGNAAPVQRVAKFVAGAAMDVAAITAWLDQAHREGNPIYSDMAGICLGQIKPGTPPKTLLQMVTNVNRLIDMATPAAAPAAAHGGAAAAAAGHAGPPAAPAAPPQAIQAPLNPAGGAMPAAAYAGAAPAAAPVAVSTPKTYAEVATSLKRELALCFAGQSVKFDTGYNGRGTPNETITEATRVQLLALWDNANKAALGIPAGTYHLHYGWSLSGRADNVFDFIVKESDVGKGIFNFHLKVK